MKSSRNAAPHETDPPSASERIAHATLQLISEHGLSDVTMSAIAREAGVARQTLYNHYPDVDSIVGAVVERHQRDSLRALDAVLATMISPTDSLEHLVRHTAAMEMHGHPRLKHGFASPVQLVLDTYDRQMTTAIATILRDGIEVGEFRATLEPESDALVIQRMIEAVGELVAKDRGNAASITETVITTLNSAVGVSPRAHG